MTGKVWAFAIYSVLYEAIIWGLFGWAVFVQGRSPWWLLLAVFMSAAQAKPHHFGIDVPNTSKPTEGQFDE